MFTNARITANEYLSTAYRPDRDYVDGVVVERNVGERDRARLQMMLAAYLHTRRREWGIHVYPEQRLQVSAGRFRIPDICVVAGAEPEEQVLTAPPFVCIEILSKDDRLSEMQERVDDYLAFGVPNVWNLNPRNRKACRCTSEGMLEVAELRTRDPEIVVPLQDLFE